MQNVEFVRFVSFLEEIRVVSFSRFSLKVTNIDFLMNFLKDECSLGYLLRRLYASHT